jgi:hypothetical protein|tara:strand:+ start:503 stop:931 length:429 start_codon:yes stop_codon:yes gene_type:complete
MQIVKDLTFTKKIDFLKSIGSDKIEHSGATLLEHLIGTSEKLKDMGAPQYLQDAGLFHSVYGTVYFMPDDGLIENRQVVKNLIGDKAEEIAYWFCILDKPRNENIWNIKSDKLRQDLIMLEQANQDDMSENNIMTWEEAYDV